MTASHIFPLAFIFAALFDNSLQARQSLRTGEDIHRGVPWNWRAKARMTFRRPFLRPVGSNPQPLAPEANDFTYENEASRTLLEHFLRGGDASHDAFQSDMESQTPSQVVPKSLSQQLVACKSEVSYWIKCSS